ncbi:MAG TPA: recombinase family protein [Hyphomicrobiaceae bacterium]
MRVAIYARFSSDLQDARSITDQLALAREHAARQGWLVVAEFTDAAISGASMANRAGLQDLMRAAQARLLDAVLTESLDRLSRDLADSAALHRQLAYWGVRIVTLADGDVNKMLVAVKGLLGSMFLDDLAQKTKRGQVGRVKAGRIPGGRCYGYDVVRDGEDRGKRTINEPEAAIVRRIYAEYVEGRSPLKVVQALNTEGIPGPRGGHWNVSALLGSAKRRNGLLNNSLYAGRITYNRQSFIKDPATGRRQARANPSEQWLTQDVPELAIVSRAVFEAAEGRRATRSRPNPNVQRRPKHLLSGLLSCAACGGSVVVRTRKDGVIYFGCSVHMNRRGCENGRFVPAPEIEGRVLAALKAHLLAPDVIKTAIEAYRVERVRLSREAAKTRASLERELAEINRKIKWIIREIENGRGSAKVSDRLYELETREEAVKSQLALANGPDLVELHPQAAERYAAKVADIHAALARGDAAGHEAINLVRELITRVRVIPTPKGEPIGLEIAGDLAALLGANNEGTPVVSTMVAGARFSRDRHILSATI